MPRSYAIVKPFHYGQSQYVKDGNLIKFLFFIEENYVPDVSCMEKVKRSRHWDLWSPTINVEISMVTLKSNWLWVDIIYDFKTINLAWQHIQHSH
jgi:hypothetical protein